MKDSDYLIFQCTKTLKEKIEIDLAKEASRRIKQLQNVIEKITQQNRIL